MRERLFRRMARLRAQQAEGAQRRKASLRQLKRVFLLSLVLTVLFAATMGITAHAAGDFTVNISPGGEAGEMGPLEVIFILAFLSLLPSVVLMFTSFTRIIIVLGFVRTAMGTNQSPPNMVLIGLAIFLTLFIMMPVLTEMNEEALQPFQAGELDTVEALEAASQPLKKFMLEQTERNALATFLNMADMEIPEVEDVTNPVEYLELPITVIAPAFIVSEISRAFMMGFLVYLPFLVIDMVVASILMSMGMVMLPPAMISLPFKLLMFVLVDGWNLTVGTLVNSYTFT